MERLTYESPQALDQHWIVDSEKDEGNPDPIRDFPREQVAHEFGYYASVRWDVISLIPSGVQSVLEVGCGAGGTGRALKELGIGHTIGLELNPAIAEVARTHYDRLLIGDAETMPMDSIPRQSLDCILYPDVLEHFRDPWLVFERNLDLLRPGGYVVASIPNVRYYRAVKGLVLRGEWEYQDAGILDRGHLRFFTLKSILRLFEENGLTILTLKANTRGSHLLKLANWMSLNRLAPFLVKQYVVLGRKDDRGPLSGLHRWP
ncbi:MAG: class I SAM-dependent methyltransferase [Thermodesulfobacteriota bacterium]